MHACMGWSTKSQQRKVNERSTKKVKSTNEKTHLAKEMLRAALAGIDGLAYDPLQMRWRAHSTVAIRYAAAFYSAGVVENAHTKKERKKERESPGYTSHL